MGIRPGTEGSILILTLCVVALVSIMAYGLIARVRLGIREEAWASSSSEAELELRTLSSFMLARFQHDESHDVDSYQEAWARPYLADSTSLLGDLQTGDAASKHFILRGRVIDECGKVNINLASKDLITQVLTMAGSDSNAAELASAIADWRDPLGTGADRNYYASLDPPYAPANADLKHVDELLFVRGVSPDLFFGEDSNHNGVLDSNEDDGAVLPPQDNADGRLQPGLVDLFTVCGDGTININGAQEAVVRAVLRATVADETTADKITDAVLQRRRGPDRLDGTDDDKPFATEADLAAVVTSCVGTNSPVDVPATIRPFGVTSDYYRFLVAVEMPELHVTKSAELLVTRKDKELRVLEWHDTQ